MTDVLIMLVFAIVSYIFYKIMLKEPIIPWKNETTIKSIPLSNNKKKAQKKSEEPLLFENLFEEVKDITNHMIRFNDDSFTLIAEVEPVNYFLRSQEEQENIDKVFEAWLASINYPVQFYLQNRYIDITEPIENMVKNMNSAEDLNENALDYGYEMIKTLKAWQKETPRYETKRYLIFHHKINLNDIHADSQQEYEEKLIEKTFAELMRRYHAAKSQLRKAEINVSLLPTEGIYELLYYTFNRRKAVKLRFKDMVLHENNALYITSDQTDEHIEAVKEEFEENEKQIETTEKNYQAS